jgi:hypothetical protein
LAGGSLDSPGEKIGNTCSARVVIIAAI